MEKRWVDSGPNIRSRQVAVKIVDRSRLVKSAPGIGTRMPSKPVAKTRSDIGLPISVIKPQPFALPAKPRQESSKVLRRQVGRPAQSVVTIASLASKEPEQRKPGRSKLQIVLVSMALMVFGLGLLVNLQTVQTNQHATAQVAALAKSDDDAGSKPSETKPRGSSYQVAPNLPKYLKISKLGVNARVIALGVTSQNQLKAPTNIYDTGWYSASAHPGDIGSNGAVLIDGHVHGPTLPGVFAKLTKLAAGDDIQIVRGDNQTFDYEVVKTQSYDSDTMDMSLGLTSIKPGQPGLNLITCGGKYDKTAGEYTQRTMVFAVQKN